MQPEKLSKQAFNPVPPHRITHFFADRNANTGLLCSPLQREYQKISAVPFSPFGKTFQKSRPLEHPFLLRKTLFFHKSYGVKRFLPFCLLLFKIRRPAAVLMRKRKPWVLFFFKLLG